MLSFLITYYNRPQSLSFCVDSINSLNLENEYEIIVSDDCSEKINIEKIKHLEIDKLILSKFNTGLSSNINRGIAECNGDYIIYLQEDFALDVKFKHKINKILKLIAEGKVDMVRLKSSVKFKDFKIIETDFKVIPRLSLRNFLVDHYRYSDNPFVV